MLSLVARVVLTLTALAPVLLTYAWSVRQQDSGLALLLVTAAALLTLLCVNILHKAEERLEKVSLRINGAEAADRENVAFLLLYISPLFGQAFLELNWSIALPVVLVFGLVTLTGYNYHFSPLLGLLGWHAYKVNSSEGITYVLLTKRQLRSALGPIVVRQLTEYVLIEFRSR